VVGRNTYLFINKNAPYFAFSSLGVSYLLPRHVRANLPPKTIIIYREKQGENALSALGQELEGHAGDDQRDSGTECFLDVLK
jgi:hypothetical protein